MTDRTNFTTQPVSRKYLLFRLSSLAIVRFRNLRDACQYLPIFFRAKRKSVYVSTFVVAISALFLLLQTVWPSEITRAITNKESPLTHSNKLRSSNVVQVARVAKIAKKQPQAANAPVLSEKQVAIANEWMARNSYQTQLRIELGKVSIVPKPANSSYASYDLAKLKAMSDFDDLPFYRPISGSQEP